MWGPGQAFRNGLKAWSWKKGPKKTLKSPMDPLRVKWWGPKHLGPSYFCELSLPTKFQTSKTSPSFKFWWGNSSSSSCDSGKTKSTPSLSFGLRLEFDKITITTKTIFPLTICLLSTIGPGSTRSSSLSNYSSRTFLLHKYSWSGAVLFHCTVVPSHKSLLGELPY